MNEIRSTIKKNLIDARDTLNELINRFNKDNYIVCNQGDFTDDLAFVNLAIARAMFYTTNDEEEYFFKGSDDNTDVKEENEE